MSLGDRKLSRPRTVDEGCVLVPFSFTINGTTTPDGVLGDCVKGRAVTRTSAGLFSFVLTDKPYAVVGGGANISGGATEDITLQVDATAASTTGVITVRTKTGATATDPSDNQVVLGHLIVKTTDRRTGA